MATSKKRGAMAEPPRHTVSCEDAKSEQAESLCYLEGWDARYIVSGLG